MRARQITLSNGLNVLVHEPNVFAQKHTQLRWNEPDIFARRFVSTCLQEPAHDATPI